jgi:hypothetical protein
VSNWAAKQVKLTENIIIVYLKVQIFQKAKEVFWLKFYKRDIIGTL